MICSKCGKELSETTKFCNMCGTPNENYRGGDAPQVPAYGFDGNVQNYGGANYAPQQNIQYGAGIQPNYNNTWNNVQTRTPASKKKGGIIAAVVGITVAAAAAIGVVYAVKNGGNNSFQEETPVSAIVNYTDKEAFFLLDRGVVTVEGEYSYGESSPDQNHLYLMDESYKLYHCTASGEPERIMNSVGYATSVKNDGVDCIDKYGKTLLAYNINEKKEYQLDLDTDKPYYINSYLTAASTISAATVDKKNNIHVYSTESGNYDINVASSKDYVSICGISDSGNTVIWSETDEYSDTSSVYVYTQNGDIEPLTNMHTDESSVHAIFFNNGNDYAIYNYTEQKKFIWYSGGKAKEFTIPEQYIYTFYDQNGKTIKSDYTNVTGLYFTTSSDYSYGYDLYYLDPQMSKPANVLSDINSFFIANGYLYYYDTDNDLYAAKIHGENVSDKKKISYCEELYVSENKKTAVILKDYTLYVTDLTNPKHELTEISGDLDLTALYGNVSISSDGSEIYCIANIDTTDYVGTLYKLSPKAEPKKIEPRVTSLYKVGNTITAEKYNSSNSTSSRGTIENDEYVEFTRFKY